MIEQLIETMQKYGDPKRNNSILGLNFKERFTYDEEERLVNSMSDLNPRKIKVRDYYESFGINPEESNIARRISEVDRDKNPFEWLLLIGSLPLKASGSIDDFLDYEITNEILDISKGKIQNLRKSLLEEYNKRYQNLEIPRTLKKYLRNIINELHDTLIFGLSFGGITVLRESEEDAYRKALTQSYQESRRRLEENIPQIAETILAEYFKFKNNDWTQRKVENRWIRNIQTRRFKEAGIDVSKYIIPSKIDYNKKELKY